MTTPAEPGALPRSARAAVLLAFGVQGFCFISLTTRLPRLESLWHAGALQISGLLLGIVLLSGVGSLSAERIAPRVGSGRLLRWGMALQVVGIPTIMLSDQLLVAVVGALTYAVGVGLVDASGNMQAVTLEHHAQRSLLPSFHGAWTLGGVIAAGIALVTAQVALPWMAGLAAVPLLGVVAPYLAQGEDHAPDVEVPGVSWRPLVMVGLALMIFYMIDTATATWGPLFLRDAVAAPERWVALASFPYLIAAGLLRLAGDPLTDRFGATGVLRVGAVVSVAALAVIVFADSWLVAVLGFTVLGAGAALIAPLSFSAAARIAGGAHDRATRQRIVDATIARFNQFNYLGALLGAVMTGVVGNGNLRFGFAVPMVLGLGLWPLAQWFERPTRVA